MQWRRPGGRLITILITGTLAFGEVLRWFFGNFFYNTLWTIIGDNFSFKEADLISYFLGNFIPFVLAAGIVATIYVAIRYELNRTYSQIPKTSETPGTAPSRGASSPSPPVRAPLPSETAIKRDRASLVAPSVTAELNPPASTSATKRESPIITEPKATKSCPLAGLDLSALYSYCVIEMAERRLIYAVRCSMDIASGCWRGRRSDVGASSRWNLRHVVRDARAAPRGV